MTYANYLIKECPDSLELEQHFLYATPGHLSGEQSDSHVSSCTSCRKMLNEIDGIYESTVRELTTAVSGNVLDLACKITCLPVQTGFFSCIPAQVKLESMSSVYQIKMLSIGKGKLYKTFAQMEKNNSPEAAFNIRVITDPESKNLLLYFSDAQTNDYHNWLISIPGIIDRVKLTGNGSAQIPLIKIEDLHNNYIYITIMSENGKKKKIIEVFQESLSREREHAC
jgi:hypothetical protein